MSTVSAGPLISRFTIASDGVQSFYSVSQTSDGRVLVGGDEGVIEFDGSRWRSTDVTGPVRMLLPVEDRIWTGGFGAFGHLKRAATGELVFTDVSAPFRARMGNRVLADIWDVAVRPEGIWFVSLFDLFLAAPDGSVLGHWYNPDRFGRLSVLQGRTVIQWRGEGLREWQNGTWTALPGSSDLAAPVTDVLIALSDDELLAVQAGKGMRRYRRGVLTPAVNGVGSAKITHGIHLPDQAIALSTHDGRVLFWRESGIESEIRLSKRFVNRLHYDAGGGLWAVSGMQLVRIQRPGRWQQWSVADGVENSIISVRETGGRLHGMSYGQVLERVNGTWRALKPLPGEQTYWDVLREGSALLLATQFRLEQVVNGRVSTLGPKDLYPRRFIPSARDPKLVYVATSIGLAIVRRQGEGWQLVAQHTDLHDWMMDVIEDADQPGRLWAAGLQGGIRRLDFSADWQTLTAQTTVLAPPEGNVKAEMRLSRLGGELVASSRNGLFVQQNGQFIKTSLDGLSLLAAPGEILSILEDKQGNAWASGSTGVYRRLPGGIWNVDEIKSFRAGVFTDMTLLADGGIAIASEDSIFALDPHAASPSASTVSAFLADAAVRNVGMQPETLALTGGANIRPDALSVQFSIGLTDYGRHVPPMFQARLRGHDDAWSNWSTTARFDFARLPAGQYGFQSRARDSSGRIHELPEYSFTVLPAWHESTPVRLVMLLSLALLLWGAVHLAVRWRTRRLDVLVADRTRELAAANQRLEDLASLDGLTGVYNRRRFDELLQDELRRAQQQGAPFALLLIDIDHFKQYNDQHGHLAGDDVLRAAGALLRRAGMAARYGGEEFAILLTGQYALRAMDEAEAMRAGIASLPFNISASIGVAVANPAARETAVELVARADAALYAAKRAGRNQVCSAD